MSNDLVVGVVIALMVVASVSYMIHQRRKGISSCGCKGCTRCTRADATAARRKTDSLSKTGGAIPRLPFLHHFSSMVLEL